MDGGEREFFKKLKQAITSNPFSSERTEVDMDLAGVSATTEADGEVLKKLLYRVSTQLEKISRKTQGRKEALAAADFELYRYGILFDLFHRYTQELDQLINEQVAQGEKSCTVTFGPTVIKNLTDAGFSQAESLRFFGLFYQMRRAFFFIRAISGQSSCVQELRKSLWNNIFTNNLKLYESYLWNRMEDFSTMLLGETGTGKGLAASAIGRSGFIPYDEKKGCFRESFAKTFISINLSQYPEQLIESELFGHKKGAFTGAIEAHDGILSRCSPFGAIFIDEIGDVATPVQIKLLQVLQEREFTPVGSHNPKRFQGRVIAATNKSVSKLREEEKFREDFYYRLCSDVIEVPSLRQRLKDNSDEINILLSFIVERIVGRPSTELVEKLGTFILDNQPDNYPWPGNIRELEQCVRQVLLNNKYEWQKSDKTETSELLERVSQGTFTANQLMANYCNSLYQKLGTYEAVAKVTSLDRRTVKKHVLQGQQN